MFGHINFFIKSVMLTSNINNSRKSELSFLKTFCAQLLMSKIYRDEENIFKSQNSNANYSQIISKK